MRNHKVDVSKLVFLPVPPGLRMKYKHHYTQENPVTVTKLGGTIEVEQPKKLVSTLAVLEDEAGKELMEGYALVNPKDTPIKKLGRCIAHNRCIANYVALSTQPLIPSPDLPIPPGIFAVDLANYA